MRGIKGRAPLSAPQGVRHGLMFVRARGVMYSQAQICWRLINPGGEIFKTRPPKYYKVQRRRFSTPGKIWPGAHDNFPKGAPFRQIVVQEDPIGRCFPVIRPRPGCPHENCVDNPANKGPRVWRTACVPGVEKWKFPGL